MKKPDQSQRFLFNDHAIRGQHVSLDHSWREIAQQGGLEGRGLSLLGEALVLVSLLMDTLKIDGSITLQIRGTGPLGLLVVEANSRHEIRGMANQQAEIENDIDLQQVFGSNSLVITIKQEGAEPYQGIAPLAGSKLSQAMEHYFETSEQLATRFWVACDEHNASGMLVQQLPSETSKGIENIENIESTEGEDEDAWDRLLHLAATTTDKELQVLPIEELLMRLFHEETVSLFEPKAIKFFCHCSRKRTEGMLLTLGKPELDETLEQEGDISVNCDFCNAHYRFDKIDIEQLFSPDAAVAVSDTTH